MENLQNLNEKEKEIRKRMFEYAPRTESVNLEKVINYLEKTKCEFLVVLHDKDDTTPHYHIYIKLENSRTITDLARQLETEPQFIQYIKKWDSALAYAFHLTPDAEKENKYQYSMDAVKHYKNIDVKAVYNKALGIKEKRLTKEQKEEWERLIMDDYANFKINKKDLSEKLGPVGFNLNYNKINKITEYRLQKLGGRKMEVLYITGLSGAGKTTLAKYLATKAGLDYFVSGSGKDILDNYNLEECIILDDYRAGNGLNYSEFLKLADNHTNSSISSRYKNKDISRCKLLIITSLFNPVKFYHDFRTDDSETFYQVKRRMGYSFLEIEQDNILLKTFSNQDKEKENEFNQFKINESFILLNFTMSDVYEYMGVDPQENNHQILNSIINKIQSEKMAKLTQPAQQIIQ